MAKCEKSKALGYAMQLSLFDLEVPRQYTGVEERALSLAHEVLETVPKDQQRLFLLRLYFKCLMQDLALFSQKERETFAIWLVEEVLGVDKREG
jgi:hypothetical protein